MAGETIHNDVRYLLDRITIVTLVRDDESELRRIEWCAAGERQHHRRHKKKPSYWLFNTCLTFKLTMTHNIC
jgi:hypothetical protein